MSDISNAIASVASKRELTPVNFRSGEDLTNKFQFEFVEENGGITINVYDPICFNNWDGKTIMDLLEKVDPRGNLMRVMLSILLSASMFKEVHKVVDVRSGKVIDVSKRNIETEIFGHPDYIRAKYDERVERGVIDPDEFSFEEFETMFKKNNGVG